MSQSTIDTIYDVVHKVLVEDTVLKVADAGNRRSSNDVFQVLQEKG